MKIAIIPARGGSKRLPGKNIKLLAGKPMIAWTIEAAIESQVFDHVFVSTDDQEIADISKKHGAEVPFLRPSELATDVATTNDVVAHLVEWFESDAKKEVSVVAILQPTSPLRNAQHIKEAMQLMKDKAAKAIISVCELEYPIQFCNKLGPEGSMGGFIKLENIKRTQELESYYRLNGAIYFLERNYVGMMDKIYNERTFSFVMPSEFSRDIDSLEDFLIAEYFMLRTINSGYRKLIFEL